MQITDEKPPLWLDRSIISSNKLNWEMIIFAIILILAIFTRYYKLEPRVMSHDENSHVYYSLLLYKGNGYQHDPVTHGPFQFHIVALAYFLFGASDTTARIPTTLLSVLTVAFMWNYRRYLGRAGALVAALMFTISPYMLYYGRYVRNESFVALFGVIMLWAVLRYLETGQSRYLLWISASIVLHYTAKETSYIYSAQILLFLGIYFVYQITRKPWLVRKYRAYFLVALVFAVVVSLVGIWSAENMVRSRSTSTQAAAAVNNSQGVYATIFVISLILVGVALFAIIYFLIKGYTLSYVRQEHSFDLLILVGTLVLPLLAAFPLKAIGWPVPTNASSVENLTWSSSLHMGLVVVLMIALAIVIGLWWNKRLWIFNAALFYAIFTFLYTTYFTNTDGFFTGLLGSLGYWMAQQAVQRGTQPWYFYIFVQIPIYEYLPALGSILAGVLLVRRKVKAKRLVFDDNPDGGEEQPLQPGNLQPPDVETPPTLALFGFWVISSIAAYSYAGEKMPWLTVHMALPLILFAAWAIGNLIDTVDWTAFRARRGPLVFLLLIIFILGVAVALGLLLSANPPLHGKSLAQLRSTGTFFFSLIVILLSGLGLGRLLKDWPLSQLYRLAGLIVFALLGILTARTAFTASFINYDRPAEYLVYAHCGPGVKEVMSQIEDISRLTTDGLNLKVAYDNETSYPYWWYLRDYPNAFGFGGNPTRELREYPVILVGDPNYSKIEPVVKQDYYYFDYIRIWWPNEDYKTITWSAIDSERRLELSTRQDLKNQQPGAMTVLDYLARVWRKHIRPFFVDARVRDAIWQIWLNRDYTRYAELTGHTDLTQATWSPSGRMRLYVRKDVASQLWDYGPVQTTIAEEVDPYQGRQVQLSADKTIGFLGSGDGQLQGPRGMALAPDGSLYVADTFNHRIQHFAADGTFIKQWGSFADVAKSEAPMGTFYEPWGIAVGLDGSVYVADTWNHRVQKFTADGEPITMWGHGISQDSQDMLGFYGPRSIVVDAKRHVLVTDTGNARVIVFDENGTPLTQFGSPGLELGQFAEPVGLALDAEGQLYVADTWNQRIQVFMPVSDGSYIPETSWDIAGWKSDSVNSKPYLAVDIQGHIFATDPDLYRVLEFTGKGEIVRYWGDIGNDQASFSLPTGIAVDSQNGVWVVDSGNNRLMHFILPK